MGRDDHWLFRDISAGERQELEERASLSSAENAAGIWFVLTLLAATLIVIAWLIIDPKPLYMHLLLVLSTASSIYWGIRLHRLRSAESALLEELGGRVTYIEVHGRHYPVGLGELTERALRQEHLIGRLSQAARDGLRNVEPSVFSGLDFAMRTFREEFHPCRVTLRDGTIVERVYVIAKSRIADRWNHQLLQAEPGTLIRAEEVASVESSPQRLPVAIANALYEQGETSMGGLDFVLYFNNRRRIPYSIPSGPCDFLEYPASLSARDVAFVRIGRGGTTGRSLGLEKYRICFYEDEPASDAAGVAMASADAVGDRSILSAASLFTQSQRRSYAVPEDGYDETEPLGRSPDWSSSRDAIDAAVEKYVSELTPAEWVELERRRRLAAFSSASLIATHLSFWLLVATTFIGGSYLSEEALGLSFMTFVALWVVWGIVYLQTRRRLRRMMNHPHAEEYFIRTGGRAYYLTPDQLERIDEQRTVWLSDGLLEQLLTIEPGSLWCGERSDASGPCRYYPCQLRLADGRILERVYAIPAADEAHCGCLPLHGARRVAPHNIMSIEPSPWRLPREFSRQLVPVQSASSKISCRITFAGGISRSYLFSSVPPDFPLYPPGLGPGQISGVSTVLQDAQSSYSSDAFHVLVFDGRTLDETQNL